MPDYHKRVLQKGTSTIEDKELQRNKKIIVDELHEIKESTGWLCSQEGLKDLPFTEATLRNSRDTVLYGPRVTAGYVSMGLSNVHMYDMTSE